MRRKRLVVIFAVFLLGCKAGPQSAAGPKAIAQASTTAQETTKVNPTVQLRVSAKSEVVKEGRPIQVKPGEIVSLKVEVVHANGTTSDVTNSPNTTYFAEPPGSIVVGPAGRVTIPGNGGKNAVGGANLLSVGIIYGKPGDAELAATSVIFNVEIPKPPEQALSVTASKTDLGTGESANLKVITKLADGETQDVTSNSSTAYITTSEYRLIPEGNGKVTCVGTNNRESDSAIVSAHYGNVSDKVEFELHEQGPGPSLEIDLGKDVLQEGERTKFSVRSRKDGRVLTSRSSGTNYLIFGGKGIAEPDLLLIDDASGTIAAAHSLGEYRWRSPILFVRNGNLVGWTTLKIVHASGKTSAMQH